MAKLRLTGIKELDRALKELPKRVARKVVRQALRRGMKVIQAEAKVNCPVDTGKLRKNITVRAGKRRRRGGITIRVVSDGGGATYYGAIVEYKSHAFMRPAYDAKARAVADQITADIAAGIEREAAALNGG